MSLLGVSKNDFVKFGIRNCMYDFQVFRLTYWWLSDQSCSVLTIVLTPRTWKQKKAVWTLMLILSQWRMMEFWLLMRSEGPVLWGWVSTGRIGWLSDVVLQHLYFSLFCWCKVWRFCLYFCYTWRWKFSSVLWHCWLDTGSWYRVNKTKDDQTAGFPVVLRHYRLSGRKDIWLINKIQLLF